MLRPSNEFGQIEWIPQAIIKRPISYFENQFGFKFDRGSDDLDEYEEAIFSLDGLPIALMHYRGYPPETTTVYLPFGFHDIARILQVIGAIAKELELPPDAIFWQRSDNPDL
jgi:predicted enzyme related to lactoylglutathione lyase